MPDIDSYPTVVALSALDRIIVRQTNEDGSVTTRRTSAQGLMGFAAIQTGITAVAGGQTSATPLTGLNCNVTTVPPGGGVILTVPPGYRQKVFNRCRTGQELSVYPAEGMRIEAEETNAAVGVADLDATEFFNDGTIFVAT
jgi:hypothetical protein